MDDVCWPSNLIYLPPGSPRAREVPKGPRPATHCAHSAVRLINMAHWVNLAARSRVRRNLGAMSRDT